MAFGILNFIDADGVDLAERAVLQAMGDDVFDRVENLFPGSAEGFRRFFPGRAARPTGEEEHISLGQRALAIGPGNFFDDDGAAAAAIDPPHGVQQEDEKSPERDELEAALGKLIIAGRRLVAARADRSRTLARPDGDFDAFVVRTECGAVIEKSPEPVAGV